MMKYLAVLALAFGTAVAFAALGAALFSQPKALPMKPVVTPPAHVPTYANTWRLN